MKKKENGQSLVEFALVLPLLILLLFGMVDFGRVFHAYLTIDHAGREAARAVSVATCESMAAAENIAKAKAVNSASSIDLKEADVNVGFDPPPVPPTDPPESGSNAEITINYDITFLTPVIGDIVGPFTLTDSTTMRVE